jgi:competence protein ComEA
VYDAYLLNPVYVVVVALSVVALNAPTGVRRPETVRDAMREAAPSQRMGERPAATSMSTSMSTSRDAAEDARRGEGGSLATNKLDVNTATAEEFERLDGIGPVLAANVVQYRAQHGPFRQVADLLRVPGIGEKKLATLTPWVQVRTPAAQRVHPESSSTTRVRETQNK